MTIQEAIAKAKEGGAPWEPWNVQQPHKLYVTPSEVFMSPEFWRCLGKAMGWKKYTWTSWKGWNELWTEYPTDDDSYNSPFENAYCQRHITYVMFWHRFIDHLAEGKDIESFFKNL
jgi:hypothetical protein